MSPNPLILAVATAALPVLLGLVLTARWLWCCQWSAMALWRLAFVLALLAALLELERAEEWRKIAGEPTEWLTLKRLLLPPQRRF